MLTLLASFAQEESRSASENQKWRIQKMFEEGRPNTGRMLGYRLVDGTLQIVPEEAAIVKMIFSDYLSGMGRNVIVKKLNRMGVPTMYGGPWRESTLYCILTNDVYSAAFPAALLPIFKRFKNISGVGGGASSGTQETFDLFALAGEGQVFGVKRYSFNDEVAATPQFNWYKTPANRIKKLNGAACSWWKRSPSASDSNDFERVDPGGKAAFSDCNNTGNGIAPFGCI